MKRLAACFCLFLLMICSAQAGKPKPRPTLVKLDPQTETIEDLKLAEPKQSCLNWEWASIVEASLGRQGLSLSQTDLVLKANGGEVCALAAIELVDIKKTVEGIYVQPDGSKVEVDAVILPGVPRDVGYLLGRIRDQRPLLILWRGHPYALKAIEYDEYVYPNDQRMYEARKLMLLDPESGKLVTFDKEKDNALDLGGTLEVRVGPIQHFR
ncbi:MAG TPA: hypothetical protein VFP40_03275 [Terriglobales bacterium]|nr:hypothetical protein [Terriglobales bacterium]